jgi:hypothetical protein
MRLALALVFAGIAATFARAQSEVRSSGQTDADARVPERTPDVVYPNTMGPLWPVQMPKMIFFPPNPPPVGAMLNVPDAGQSFSDGPSDLEPFVTEPFYAPLSTFISPVVTGYQGGATMSREEADDLRNFMRLRATLLDELREKIASLEHADARTRLREFQAFAAAQHSRLVELEDLAEKARASLARKADWSEMRQWRLGSGYQNAPRGALRPLEQQVVRAAAFYQDGLSPAQRRLTRELAMEMEDQIYHPRDAAAAARDLLFFQPETARIQIPRDLPAPLAAKLDAFRDEKDRLKKEIDDAIYQLDGEFFSITRTRALRKLAEEQKPRLDELEEQAEDIRLAIARVPDFPRVPKPEPLPAAVRARIEKFQAADRALAERTGEGLAEAAANSAQPLPPRETPLARREWLQSWAERFRNHGKTLAADDVAAMEALINELDSIHDQLELVTHTKLDMPEGAAPEAFLKTWFAREKVAGAEHEYDIAVLEPGLSPEQRRLLFSAAIESFDLPLPGAERQATIAPGSLIRPGDPALVP